MDANRSVSTQVQRQPFSDISNNRVASENFHVARVGYNDVSQQVPDRLHATSSKPPFPSGDEMYTVGADSMIFPYSRSSATNTPEIVMSNGTPESSIWGLALEDNLLKMDALTMNKVGA
jgi:hypothetical protein